MNLSSSSCSSSSSPPFCLRDTASVSSIKQSVFFLKAKKTFDTRLLLSSHKFASALVKHKVQKAQKKEKFLFLFYCRGPLLIGYEADVERVYSSIGTEFKDVCSTDKQCVCVCVCVCV